MRAAGLGLLLLVGCAADASATAPLTSRPTLTPSPTASALPRVTVEITTSAGEVIVIDAELADTPEAQAQGLMGRESLAPDAGLLIALDEPQYAHVWMKDTRIALSAAWYDEAGTIVWIEDLQPCGADPCKQYGAPSEVVGILEVNLGAFERWGVAIGDNVEVERAD